MFERFMREPVPERQARRDATTGQGGWGSPVK
jgi:hypothetical protein